MSSLSPPPPPPPPSATQEPGQPQGGELLFFDTFSHEVVEELNLDLVQFPSPVIVEEVRVIPLGARVQANFPGGVRLGATNPTRFKLEFFVNDLGKPGAATFESLGVLQYNQSQQIHLHTSRVIPTDGLVLKGMYNAITLAVYGTLSKSTAEQLALAGSTTAANSSTAANNNSHPHPPTAPLTSSSPTPSRPTPVPPNLDVPPPNLQPHPPSGAPHPNITATSNHHGPPSSYGISAPKPNHAESRGAWPPPDRRHSPSWDSHPLQPQQQQPRRPVNGSSTHDRRSDSPGDARDSRRGSSASRDPPSSNHIGAPAASSSSATPPAVMLPVKQEPAEEIKDELMDDISDISDGDIPDVPEEEEENVVKDGEKDEEALPIKMETDDDAPAAEEKVLTSVSDAPAADAAVSLPPLAVAATAERKSLSHSPGEKMMGIPTDDLMEEISDEEAEWSDGEGVPGPGDFEFGEDWEDPIRAFDVISVELEGLPDDSSNTVRDVELESNLVSALKRMAESDVNSDWIEELEQWTKVLQTEVNSLPTTFVDLHLPNLLKIVGRCLDLDIALSHNVPTLKVRHIHQGLRFVKTAFNVSEYLAKAMILSGLQRNLMNFLEESNIAPTICVTAVQILDLTLNTKMGFDIFTGQNDLNHYRTLSKLKVFVSNFNKSGSATINLSQDPAAATMYLRLCKLGKSLGPCIKPSLCAIMSKISFLSSICNLRSEIDINVEKEASKDFSDSATQILGEVLEHFKLARVSLAQPIKLLPSRFRFQPSSRTAYYDPYPGIFAFLNEVGFLDVLLALLTYPSKSVSLSNTCCLFLEAIISHPSQSQAGLLFLRKNHKSTNSLIRYLVQASSSSMIPNAAAAGEDAEAAEQQQQPPQLTETKEQEHRLALKLAFSVHSYGVFKKMNDCLGRTKLDDYNKPGVVDNLQVLFSMTYTPAGRLAVASVLATEDNVSLLIRLVKDSLKPSEENENMNIRQAMRGYACDLIKLVLRISEDVFSLRNLATSLTDLASENEVTRINEAVAWTRPLVQFPNFSADDIPNICELISKSLENLCPMSLELITAVRMLVYFISTEHEPEHMIHKQYSLIHMYSNGIMETFKELLMKIYSQHEQPQLHTATFVGHSGYLLLSVIKPVVNIMKNILQYLIACRDIEFQDFSHIQILLKIYSLVSVVSAGSICHALSEEIKSDIMLILAAFTSPEFDLSSHASAKTSLWTQMLRELITFTRSLPHFYCNGLRVFMQLLPLPLPMLSKGELSEEEQVQITNSRKLWSTHLYPLDSDIKAMVDQFVGITDLNLSNLLKSVVIQLTDLSPLVSKMVCNSILDSLSSVVVTSLDAAAGGGSSDASAAVAADLDKCSNGPFLRTLAFFSGIMEYSCVKTTVMHLLDSPEQKQFLTYLSSLSRSCAAHEITGSKANSLFLCQEYIGNIFQTLCDPEITLVNSETFTEDQLANSIPTRDVLEIIVPSLLDQMLNTKHKHPNSVAANVRTISLLLEHDLGFSLIKQCLERTPRNISELVDKLSSLPETPSFLTITAACLEVITLLTELPAEQPLYVKPRTLSMTDLQMKTALNSEKVEDDAWRILKERVNSTEVPLADSENPSESPDLDQVVHQQIEILETQHEKLVELTSELSTAEDDEPAFAFPAAKTLLELYSQREIFSVNCLEDKLTASYWLSDIDPATAASAALASEDPTSSCDNVNGSSSHVAATPLTTNQIDLIEVSNASLQKDFDLISELRQVCEEKTLETDKQIKKVKKKSAMERKAMQNKNIISNFKAGGSVALRGRGFARPGQRPDGFRSRPPNTSRPPSLHVDDFVLLQQRGQQPTGPTGYNKQSIKAAKELFAQREAQHGMKGPGGGVPPSAVGFREATKVPVFNQGRDNGPMGVGGMPVGLRGPPPRNGPRDHGIKNSGGPMYRGGGGNSARGGGRPRGWSPSNGDDRRFNTGRRGPPHGGGWGDNRRGGPRDRRRFGGGGSREDRPRHMRSNMTR